MSETEWKAVRIPAQLAVQIDAVLQKAGFTSRSAFAQDAIRRRIDEELAKLKQLQNTATHLTENERCQLDLVAEEYYQQFQDLDEEGIRETLEDRYSQWTPEKIHAAVEYVCSLKPN